ncbi:uncharacterized protein TRIADDRAFT_57902 [Trichoplax adhaerens]|uniref:Peptidase M48 domain-containing protein n=1 Tax=Trichoplax adhaerens TaxID=10228 RepID=B3S226_TRIAD|nr:hypothetical protein TRIADDRAFT_57902 [Trichoplax adhaerens]EDV23040.1 hypothetical protein TRIADDRAFT_57902 [Trichoplax adhaerens]|eukprot:XP_002113950.1 hypothetical protein TRIADDRAFT_57902 [Trichoplax adhaerens]
MRVIATSAIATGLLTYQLYPHLFPNRIRPKHMTGFPIMQETMASFKEICQKLDIDHSDKVKVYVDKSLTAGNLGNSWLPNGAILSLPCTIYFKTVNDVIYSRITFGNQKIEREDLLKSFITSANCNNFQMAHELSHLKLNDFIPRSIVMPTFYIIASGVYSLCNKFFLGSTLLRGLSKAAVIAVAIGCFVATNSYIIYRQEYRADHTAASIDPTYLIGGIELMHKYLDWENKFNKNGPSKPFLTVMLKRLSHPPVERRLQRLLDMQEQRAIADSKN